MCRSCFFVGKHQEKTMNTEHLKLIINGVCTLGQIIAAEIGKKK